MPRGWPGRARTASPKEEIKKSKLVMLYYFFLWQCSEKSTNVSMLIYCHSVILFHPFKKCVSCIFSTILQVFSISISIDSATTFTLTVAKM